MDVRYSNRSSISSDGLVRGHVVSWFRRDQRFWSWPFFRSPHVLDRSMINGCLSAYLFFKIYAFVHHTSKSIWTIWVNRKSGYKSKWVSKIFPSKEIIDPRLAKSRRHAMLASSIPEIDVEIPLACVWSILVFFFFFRGWWIDWFSIEDRSIDLFYTLREWNRYSRGVVNRTWTSN